MAEKLYRIGDAAVLLGLKTYVLRYWETEFSQLRPVRTGKGQRRYTESDMDTLRRIRYLLHDQGMTIEGARKVLAGESALSLSIDPLTAPKTKHTASFGEAENNGVPEGTATDHLIPVSRAGMEALSVAKTDRPESHSPTPGVSSVDTLSRKRIIDELRALQALLRRE